MRRVVCFVSSVLSIGNPDEPPRGTHFGAASDTVFRRSSDYIYCLPRHLFDNGFRSDQYSCDGFNPKWIERLIDCLPVFRYVGSSSSPLFLVHWISSRSKFSLEIYRLGSESALMPAYIIDVYPCNLDPWLQTNWRKARYLYGNDWEGPRKHYYRPDRSTASSIKGAFRTTLSPSWNLKGLLIVISLSMNLAAIHTTSLVIEWLSYSICTRLILLEFTGLAVGPLRTGITDTSDYDLHHIDILKSGRQLWCHPHVCSSQRWIVYFNARTHS